MAVTCRFEYKPLFNPVIDTNLPETSTLDRGPSEMLAVTISGMNRDLDDYFQISFTEIQTPRSTAPTDSFRIATFNELGEQLDIQTEGIVLILDSPSAMP
jgi:hypothetical protein